MSEITKLYENAGIKPTKNWQSCLNCKLKTETRYDDWGSEYLTCNRLERPEKCPDAKEYYPPFTAKKQIELIKLLQRKNGYKFSFSSTNDNSEYLFFALKDNTPVQELIVAGDKCYEEALAYFINTLWQDLTEEEKQQVRGILE